jgi:hypothetical protein
MADFTLKSGDTSPAIAATLTDSSGQSVNVAGASVRFQMATADYSTIVDAAATIRDAGAGRVAYEWQPGDTDRPGDYLAEWRVEYADGSIETFPAGGFHEIQILPDL